MNSNTSDLRVLVVDDEESLRDIVSQVLEEEGYKVTTASSGEEALEIFSKTAFPLIITDIRMSGISGLELLERCKAISESTQVVIMTSNASLDTALMALRNGAHDYIIKPFESLDLISKVVNSAAKQIRSTELSDVRIQELEQVNRELQEKSVTDGLTGLYNHKRFHELLHNELEYMRLGDRIGSVLFIDVDYFKQLNDTHGHQVGDKVLSAIGRILQTHIQEKEIAGRYGGEEFVLFLPGVSKEEAFSAAEELRSRIEQHDFSIINIGHLPTAVTVSIGVATYPEDADNQKELLQKADEALYAAKSRGRNRVRSA